LAMIFILTTVVVTCLHFSPSNYGLGVFSCYHAGYPLTTEPEMAQGSLENRYHALGGQRRESDVKAELLQAFYGTMFDGFSMALVKVVVSEIVIVLAAGDEKVAR